MLTDVDISQTHTDLGGGTTRQRHAKQKQDKQHTCSGNEMHRAGFQVSHQLI